jgi:hypothetical protein
MSIVNTYHYYVNSRTRDKGTINDFELLLPNPISLSADHTYFTVQVNQAVIPFSFNQINTYNNTTVYHIYRATVPLTALTGTFSLTPGNYNATNFITEWKNKLASSVAALTRYTPTFTTSFNSFDNTYSITLVDDGTYTTIVFRQQHWIHAGKLKLRL